MNFKPTKPLSLSEYPVPMWSIKDAVLKQVNEDEFRMRKWPDNEIRPDTSKHSMQFSEVLKRTFASDISAYLP